MQTSSTFADMARRRTLRGQLLAEATRADADRIRGWVKEGKSVYIYYNNDIGGHAFWNASELRSMIDVR